LLLLGVGAGPGFAGEDAPVSEKGSVWVEKVSSEALRSLAQGRSEKLRLFNFWATWCPPCVDEFPELLEIQRDFREDLEFIAVSANAPEEEEEVLTFLERHGASGRNLLLDNDDTHAVLKAFDRRWKEILPYTVLVDRAGRVRFRYEGRVDEEELRSVISRYVDRDRVATR
jgi:thiol-disulfide isomerase/thioredoxin